jgi:hypothetical protein
MKLSSCFYNDAPIKVSEIIIVFVKQFSIMYSKIEKIYYFVGFKYSFHIYDIFL